MRSTPAAGSTTWGTMCSSRCGSKYDSVLPEACGVRAEVEVAAVGDALELAPAPRVEVLDVRGRARIVGELLGIVVAQPQPVGAHAERVVPGEALLLPVLVLRDRVGGVAEVLHLHLLELEHAEREVPRRDLVAERLADLRDAERQPPARALQHVVEVHEHALRGLRPQVRRRRFVLHRADERAEQQVELALLGEPSHRAADRARVVLDVVGAHARAALEAVDERVGEAVDVPGGLPDGGLVMIAASMPTTSLRSCTIRRHHSSRMLRFISTPSGP